MCWAEKGGYKGGNAEYATSQKLTQFAKHSTTIVADCGSSSVGSSNKKHALCQSFLHAAGKQCIHTR